MKDAREYVLKLGQALGLDTEALYRLVEATGWDHVWSVLLSFAEEDHAIAHETYRFV